jgi:hypothetical protein
MATYKPIQSTVVTSATSIVTFSGISQDYTDLVLLISGQASVAGNVRITFNGDSTSTLYSTTFLDGDGTSATSTRSSSASFITGGYIPTSNYDICKIDINGYSNSSTNKTILVRAAAPNRGLSAAIVNLWRNTAPITSISFELFGSGAYRTWQPGSTFSLYGIKSGAPQALGGDLVATDGNYWYHAFRTTGSFTPLKTLSADILVVAGGGASGSSYGGAGGAGGLLSFTSQSVSATATTITVGAGGAGATPGGPSGSGTGLNGNDSQFGALTLVKGGGGGGYWYSVSLKSNGAVGGSGGGSGRGAEGSVGGVGTSGQGNTGGTGSGTSSNYAGGGGGAGAAGSSSSGGAGLTSSISGGATTGTGSLSGGSYYFAVGGTAAGGTAPAGGSGNGVVGAANTGNGGGSENNAGGSGIVIVRYPV